MQLGEEISDEHSEPDLAPQKMVPLPSRKGNE
jgi:hypothetical protein